MSKIVFGLNKEPVVERKSLGPMKPFVLELPFPPSTNALFGQAPGRKRFISSDYSGWIYAATVRLKAQRPPKFPGQVWIGITLEDTGRGDVDNYIKAIPDLLKKQGVIVDDSRKYMREVRCAWGTVYGARVEIRPYPFEQTGIAA